MYGMGKCYRTEYVACRQTGWVGASNVLRIFLGCIQKGYYSVFIFILAVLKTLENLGRHTSSYALRGSLLRHLDALTPGDDDAAARRRRRCYYRRRRRRRRARMSRQHHAAMVDTFKDSSGASWSPKIRAQSSGSKKATTVRALR
jgi:hypothetical protein